MKSVLILSGPTHEYFDSVRFIGNASSGRMGKALAEEAIRRGFEVEFVSGPVSAENLPNFGNRGTIHPVISAAEMLAAAAPLFPAADAIIFAAAVADYSPKEQRPGKMAKSQEEFILHLQPTPDIARTLCAQKSPAQVAVGFALQSEDGEAHARRKLIEKRLDGIVLNSPESLGSSEGSFSFLRKDGKLFNVWGRISKDACAENILDEIEQMMPHKD